jgi:hypothetical protein
MPRLALAFVVLAAWVSSASAQDPTCPETVDSQPRLLASRFAPVLRFAPGERYFPTIPFFTAFDTLPVTERDSLLPASGYLDSVRAVGSLTKDGRVSWDRLDSEYRRRVHGLDRAPEVFLPPPSAVFYRVRCLHGNQNKQLWGFLRNDPQAWNRSGIDSLYELGLRDAQFAVVEYFLYYIRDAGLQGHQHDIERIVVFLPRRINASEAIKRGGISARAARLGKIDSLVDSMRIVVGTGHSSSTPNNVLVVLNKQATQLQLPSVLIELGGHSSAPDLDRDSEFHPGMDINWNLNSDIWGTRDYQAISGSGYLGAYATWMTLPRYPGKSVVLARRAEPGGEKELERVLDTVVTLGPQQRDTAATNAPAVPSDTTSYILLPVALFQTLARYVSDLPEVQSSADTAAIVSAARPILNDSLRLLLRRGWGFKGLRDTSASGVLDALRWMHYWTQSLDVGGKASAATAIWQHPEYEKSPIVVLKRRLYRPTLQGIQNAGDVASLVMFGYDAYLGRGGQQAQIGLVIPALPGKLSIPGYVEVQLGLYRRRLFGAKGEPSRPSLSVTYERYWRRTFSWYIKPFNWVFDRPGIEQDPEASDVSFGFGGSIMPFWPVPNFLGGLFSRLRIRAGLRIDARGLEPGFRRLELQTTWYMR